MLGQIVDDHCFHLAKKTKRAVRKKDPELLEFNGTDSYSVCREFESKQPSDEAPGLKEEALKAQKQPVDETRGLKEKALKANKQPADETQGLIKGQRPAVGSPEPSTHIKQPAIGSLEPSTHLSSDSTSSLHLPFGPSSQPLGDALLSCSHGKKKSDFKVMELFSPPRITLEAQARGFQTTSIPAFDNLECGWNFFDARDRARFWEVLLMKN